MLNEPGGAPAQPPSYGVLTMDTDPWAGWLCTRRTGCPPWGTRSLPTVPPVAR